MVHKPVLLEEVIGNLNLKPGMTVVDGTLGAGGHSIAILEKVIPGGKLISIDWDKRAIENFKKILTKEGYDIPEEGGPAPIKSNAHGENFSPSAFVPLFLGDKIVAYWRGANNNYANLDKVIGGCSDITSGADAIFADLGFSSDQIEDEERGFSFSKDGPLDMRYSPEMQKLTAADIVNGYSEKDLADIFWKYGEERNSRKIAKGIIEARKMARITRTGELVKIVSGSIPEPYKKKKIYPVKSCKAGLATRVFSRVNFATKVFQAIRIEVNQELSNLKKFLDQSVGMLAGGGRLAIISFHSLEDRIVKNFFQKESRDCICPPNFPKCLCNHKKRLKIITKKPIVAGEREIGENPRARSAKLRAAERI